MIRIIAAGILALGLLGQLVAQTPEERLQREEEKITGTWRVTTAKANGERVPPEHLPRLKLTFKNGKFTAQLDKGEPQEGTYKLDPSKNPKQMDLNRTQGPKEGRNQIGIYEFAGDTLKICACESGNKRPENFDTRDKPGYTVLVLRRVP
jgi:uncharacterized protein (TIGR03067 family)